MPANTAPDSSQWKNTVLLHNGAAHNLGNLVQLALASTAPEVTVDLDQIGPADPIDADADLFKVQPKNSEINQLPLVLYKYGGRYYALVGEAAITRARTNKQTQVTGKLLSTPALKKARIIKVEVDVTSPSIKLEAPTTPPSPPAVSQQRRNSSPVRRTRRF